VHAGERRRALGRVKARPTRALVVSGVARRARERNDAARVVARKARRTIAGGATLWCADPAAANEGARTIRVERTRSPGDDRARVRLCAGERALRGELARLGARRRNADLALQAIERGRATVATLVIDAADLALHAVRIPLAGALDVELADVEGPVARHATLAGVAVPRRHAGLVAALKGADQGRIAVRVDDAPFREPRVGGQRIRAPTHPPDDAGGDPVEDLASRGAEQRKPAHSSNAIRVRAAPQPHERVAFFLQVSQVLQVLLALLVLRATGR